MSVEQEKAWLISWCCAPNYGCALSQLPIFEQCRILGYSLNYLRIIMRSL